MWEIKNNKQIANKEIRDFIFASEISATAHHSNCVLILWLLEMYLIGICRI
jgi:hypothetical protein